jgi:hypothetical protein
MFGSPDGVKAHVFGRLQAIKLFSDYLMLGLAACRVLEEMQYAKFHCQYLLSDCVTQSLIT